MSRQIGALPSILFHCTLRILRSEKLLPSLLFRNQFSIVFLFIFKNSCLYLQSLEQDVLDLSTLTAYVSYARKHIHPQLSDEAAEELTHGYVELRRRGNFPGSSKKVNSSDMVPNGILMFTCSTELINYSSSVTKLSILGQFLKTVHDSIFNST
jgi:hypothetical protein